jgi:hypothetical protein
MEMLQLNVSKRRLNNSNRSAKQHSRSVDNNRRRSPGKLRLSSSCNLRIINRRNNSLSSSKSIDNRRSLGKLRLSNSCNMRISNRRNNSLSSSRRRSAGNLSLSSRCNKYSSLSNRRSPGNLHCRRGTRPRKPLSKNEILNCVNGTAQDQPKYKTGAPMLSEANVKAAGPNCAKLHAYIMEHNKDKLVFPAKVDQYYFKGRCGALILNIEFSSVYNRITLASLDVTFMTLWTL